jgi:hypothetical protein
MSMDDDVTVSRVGAVAGAVAVFGNVAGIVVLQVVPDCYRPGTLDVWRTALALHGDAIAQGGLWFALGVLALGPWAHAMGQRSPLARMGAQLVLAGSVVNGIGSLLPVVAAWHVQPACVSAEACAPALTALLGTALTLDALFNVLFGFGLLLIGTSLTSWRRVLAMAAGALSIPVGGQVVSDGAAKFLAIAGPVWLLCLIVESVQLWRRR